MEENDHFLLFEGDLKMKKEPKKRDFFAKELLCSGKYRQRVVESKKSKLKRKKFNLKDEMKPYSKTFVKIDGFGIRLFFC